MENQPIKTQSDVHVEERMRKERAEKAIDAGTKALAIFGLIIFLALISIGIIKIAPPIIRGIAAGAVSVTSLPVSAPSFTVTTSQTAVESGQAFVVSWASPNNEAGSFTLSYPCISQFYLEALGQQQSQQTVGTGVSSNTSNNNTALSNNSIIYCNTDFQFLNTSNSIVLAGYVENQSPASVPVVVPVTVHFLQNGAIQNASGIPKDTAVGTVNITILPQQHQSQISTPTSPASSATQVSPITQQIQTVGGPSTNNYPVQVQSSLNYAPNTNADLAVHIIATGIIDPNTNAFVPENKIRTGDRGAIQFEIDNQGGHPTGSWSFAVVLPTYPSYTFMSNAQPSLNPGDKIVYTIAFNDIIDQPQDTFTINADNTGEVTETNKTNNIVHGILYVLDPSGN
jgi:hypothetical protein